MNIDEIRAKIQLINISSDDTYKIYVKQMIDNLDESKDKFNLSLEYMNKINEINMIAQHAISDGGHNEMALATFDKADDFILYSTLLYSNKSFEVYKVNKITDFRQIRNLNGRSR